MEKYSAGDSFLYQLDTADMPIGLPAGEYLKEAGDADFIVVDAIGKVEAALIEGMPNLKLIHSEGVAYNLIDLEAAKRKNVYVCNSRGMNAGAVAEQTVLLMSGMLRDVVRNDRAVREGRQIQVKEGYMLRSDLMELSDCRIGLVGFGDIARAAAELLQAFGVRQICYYKRHPLSEAEAKELHVRYLPLDELLGTADIVSLHLPVTQETVKIAGDSFFSKMKQGSYFVNTARGELVDDEALIRALASGRIKMAGLDTLDMEPVREDHPLLNVPADIADRLLFSPHIGGITASSFRRSYAYIWEDIQAAAEGKRPKRTVNHAE